MIGVAAIAGAVVLTPSRGPKSDVLGNLRERIEKRAQVDLFDDFSQGLDAWQNHENLATAWAYDKNGLLSPGPLSLYTPSMCLTNYDLDMLVQIEAKGVGIAFRATSPSSYEAVELIVDGKGTGRTLAAQRYAVVGGDKSSAVVTRYPMAYDPDTLYKVHLEVRDQAFLLYVQGKLIDYWTDARLPLGGVGLFCSKREHARVAWIRVSHNKDFEGRMCAWIASEL